MACPAMGLEVEGIAVHTLIVFYAAMSRRHEAKGEKLNTGEDLGPQQETRGCVEASVR